MNADLLLLALADGFSYAGLLFLVALGLTLIFGVLGVLNVAHGSLYAFGGYTAATLVAVAGGGSANVGLLLASLVAAALIVGVVLGVALELGLLRRVQDKDPVVQLLVTFAAFMILEDVLRLIWGTQPHTANDVVTGLGTIDAFGATYTRYQLLLIPAVALVVYGLLQYFLRSTRTGKQMIAATHNAEVATAMGINAKRIRLVTFVLGGARCARRRPRGADDVAGARRRHRHDRAVLRCDRHRRSRADHRGAGRGGDDRPGAFDRRVHDARARGRRALPDHGAGAAGAAVRPVHRRADEEDLMARNLMARNLMARKIG